MAHYAGEAPDSAAPGLRRGRARSAILWSLVGVALVVAAVRIILRSHALEPAHEALRAAPWWIFAAMVGLPLLNLLLTSATFQVLTNRYGRVGFVEMSALIAGSWLFSFVGMFGRIAYHRAIHRVPVRASVLVLVQALGCSFAGVLVLLGLALLIRRAGLGDAATASVIAVPPTALLAAAGVMRARDPSAHAWRWPAALALRYLDMAAWAARYLLLFTVLSRGVSVAEAAGFAAAAQVAMLVPIQIGLREWVIGLLGAGLGVAPEPSLADSLGPGLLVDLINRAAELVVAIPLGVAAAVWLGVRWKAARPRLTH
ncbi:MAG: hypothetical protein IT438_00595 [Phycisphaerales bacterium]|nr:hypothetical protein [Phycisphaerales bacterium]